MTRTLLAHALGCVFYCLISALFVGLSPSLIAAEGETKATVDYAKQIKPVLHERCYACHGALKQEGGLRLDTAALAIQGGDSGAAIKPGDAASAILERVMAKDLAERMPPEGEPLTAGQIADLRQWIAEGAKAPADEQPERDPRTHWAFKTPVRPEVPKVKNAAWVINPIDAFIAAQHEARGLTPQPAADKLLWLRRVSLDLTGLPPSREMQLEFLAMEGNSPDPYDQVAKELLGRKQHGERWGRHWMDIWRYSDWWGLGAEVRNSQKHMWHWRDWILESLNEDKGYDQMLREMLAADELYPNDPKRLRASGFLARQYFKFNRTTWMDETVEHTSKAMLGLTFNCSKCHDHKYDPISQQAYYQMRAIFEPYQLRMDLAGPFDFEKDGIPRAFDCNLDAPTWLHIRGDDRNPDKSRPMLPGVPAFLAGEFKIKPVNLPREAWEPHLRPTTAQHLLEMAENQLKVGETNLDAAVKQVHTAMQALTLAKAAEAKAAKEGAQQANEPAPRKPLVLDTFAAANADVWETRDGDWAYVDGKLVQSRVGAMRAVMRLKQAPPADFEVRLKYTTVGGEKWQSVGISFDVTDKNDVLAYASSVAGGSKVQIAYKQGADYTYPSGSSQARAVELNKPHELVLRVRGVLVNLAVDGVHAVSFRLPIARQAGHLELVAFDAKAEFTHFELLPLPADLVLIDGDTPGKPAESSIAQNVQKAQQAYDKAVRAAKLLEPNQAIARAEWHWVKCRIAADQAQLRQRGDGEDAQTAQLIREAVVAELKVAVAKAEGELLKVQIELADAPADKKEAAQKKLAAAKTAQEKANEALQKPGTTYTPLVGAIKTAESNVEPEESRKKPFPQTSTGRRSALAHWMTDPKNPLPARVAVNHLWARHFGRGLVPTVFDFGLKGTPPSHPELLDWLTVEFVEHGWSMKHLHHLIVTSNTYRMTCSSAGAAEANLRVDPDNRSLWRREPVRMESQVIRDSLLSLAGELDLNLFGGPPLPVDQEDNHRRSLYYFHSHNEHQKFLSMFDDANVLECYRRADSVVPQQALALENSPLAANMAEKIAQRIVAGKPGLTDQEFIRAAFLTVLCTEPTPDEQAAVQEAMGRFAKAAKGKKRANPVEHARVNLVHALLNHNDFVTVR